MKITVVGIGLIGGSLALSLKRNGFASEIIGVDNSELHAEKALQLGIADHILPLNEAVSQSDIIILAVPVDVSIGMLSGILDQINDGQIVVDMGSTKRDICKAVATHPKRSRFVASHPIAGTENSGPEAAFATLFLDKVGIICDRELSDAKALHVIEKLYKSLFMRLTYMESSEHDRHIAYVSHLSHITSFTLGLTVLEVERNEKNIFDMAGSGFASTARLAKSSPAMWAPIFDQNAENLSKVLSAYIKNLELFKELIDQGERDRVFQLMEEANDIRRILSGIELNENHKIKI